MEAIVVGGGIVGSSIALHLVENGIETLLFDKRQPGVATEAGAGIISPETSHYQGEKWYEFACRSGQYYPEFLDKINYSNRIKPSFRCGELTIALDDEESEKFKAIKNQIEKRQSKFNYPNKGDIQEITPDEAQIKFPGITTPNRVLYNKNAGRIDGHKINELIIEKAINHGLVYKKVTVDELVQNAGSVTGVKADEVLYDSKKVVIAGGAWSSILTDELGFELGVQPQKGEIIHLEIDCPESEKLPVIRLFSGHYLVPWQHGKIVVGATRETGSGFDYISSVTGVQEVMEHGKRVLPILQDKAIKEVKVGFRPLSDDGNPILGDIKSFKNLYVASGHGPSGLQLGPYTGKIMADVLMGRNKLDISHFNHSRFQ